MPILRNFHPWRPNHWPPQTLPRFYTRLTDVTAFCEIIGRDQDRLRGRNQGPSHHMFRAGTVGEDKAVETVELVFRIAACPGAARGPGAERRELWVRGSERLHGVRVLARRGKQQLIKALRRRYRKDRGIDHSAT